MVAALLALVVAAAAGTVLVGWGVAGDQLSWVALGLTAVAAGMALDALAYLWIRRERARSLATLVIEAGGLRFRVRRVRLPEAKGRDVMGKCELAGKCPLFNETMQDMPSMVEMLKSRYCQGDNSQCARYMVFQALGRDAVPPRLLPGQVERAREVIAGRR